MLLLPTFLCVFLAVRVRGGGIKLINNMSVLGGVDIFTDDIFVADSQNHCIRRIAKDPTGDFPCL